MRRLLLILATLMLGLLGAQPIAAKDSFPEVISLPNGHLPEGIEIGRSATFYAGSRGDGSIYAGDLRTGQGATLVPGNGLPAVGLGLDPTGSLLFVAGGNSGRGFVYDAQTGADIAEFHLTPAPPTFINDVVVTRDAAYFTDSRQPVLYRVPLGPGGQVDPTAAFGTIPLSGDFEFIPDVTNANGIEATADGTQLIIVNSANGALYLVDPESGEATLIDLGGAVMTNGDGLLLEGETLYVVQNRLNQIAVITLSPDLTEGTVIDTITSSLFDVPTTIARHGKWLYAVNARFTTPPTPDTTYTIVQVDKR